jgi:hypothetical protein
MRVRLGVIMCSFVVMVPALAGVSAAPPSAAAEPVTHWHNTVTVSAPAANARMTGSLLDRPGPQERRKPVHSVAEAAEVERTATQQPSPVSSVVAAAPPYNWYTLEECRQQYNLDGVTPKYRNHFASCLVTTMTYHHRVCTRPGQCSEVGTTRFRFTQIGMGNRGDRGISYVAEMDQPEHVGEMGPSPQMRVEMECVALPGADCGSQTIFGITKSIPEWMADRTMPVAHFDTSASPGSGDGDPFHNKLDKVSYHELHSYFTNPAEFEEIERLTAPFRCDAAAYASGGGCQFTEIAAVHYLSLRPEDGIAEEAAHVLAAQKVPEETKPGTHGKLIPGDEHAQIPNKLTRMYPGYNSSRYDKNHSTAVETCKRYWGVDYARGPDGPRECDEYPFRSTYEGAYFSELFPDSFWSYSARPINRDHNNKAGRELGAWYTADGILDGDRFWVQVTGCDGCGGEPGPIPPGNTPPTVNAGPDTTGAEGTTIALAGSVTDPDDTPAITWSYQLGPDTDPGMTCQFGNPNQAATTIACTDDGTVTVTLSADDRHGPPSPVSDTALVTVTNVAPTAAITSPQPGQLFNARNPVPVTVTVTDPGTNDRHTCTLAFGDATPPATGTVTETAGTGTCAASHTYGFGGLGPRTITVTVADDDGATATATVRIVLYVPGHGFALQASGLLTVPATPDVHCPPDDRQTQVGLTTPVGSTGTLSVTCTMDPAIGRTDVHTTLSSADLLAGLIHIDAIESRCTAGADGITRASTVGRINGITITPGMTSLEIPGVASLYLNESTTNTRGDLVQNAVRVVKPPVVVGGIVIVPGQEIVLAQCRLG